MGYTGAPNISTSTLPIKHSKYINNTSLGYQLHPASWPLCQNLIDWFWAQHHRYQDRHFLLNPLFKLDTNGHLALWIKDFFSDWPQRASVQGSLSDQIPLNTGASHGCVLSPALFSVHLNEIQIYGSNFELVKGADDKAMVGLMFQGNDELDRLLITNSFVNMHH